MKKFYEIKSIIMLAASLLICSALFADCKNCKEHNLSKNSESSDAEAIAGADMDTVVTASFDSSAAAAQADGIVHEISAKDFLVKVADYNRSVQNWKLKFAVPTVVDFYATWCGPCKQTAPVMEKIAKKYKGKVRFYKADVDKESGMASAIGIQAIPYIVFIPVNGQPVVVNSGMGESEFESRVKGIL